MNKMNKPAIFAVRAVLGIFFAVILMRIFSPGADLATIAGVAVLLVGLAYVFDYFRSRRKDG